MVDGVFFCFFIENVALISDEKWCFFFFFLFGKWWYNHNKWLQAVAVTTTDVRYSKRGRVAAGHRGCYYTH